MNQKDYAAAFEKELRKAKFPVEKINEDVIEAAFALFTTKSLHELGINVKDYRETIEAVAGDSLSLHQVAMILNNLASLSAQQLGMSINGYTDIMQAVEDMAETWNEVMQPIQDRLVNEMNRETAKLGQQNNKAVNPNLRKS